MTRLSPRTALRRTAGGLAVAGLLAAGSLSAGALAVAAPVKAADPVFTLGGPAQTGLYPYPASGSPRKSTVGITVSNPAEDEETGGYRGEVTYTFDLSGVAGVADVGFDGEAGAECEVTGATAVCHDDRVWAGLSLLTDLRVGAAKGSKEGDSGTIRVTGAAEGATFTPFTTKVTVGGPDLVMKQLPFDQEPAPGDTQQAPITFTNDGTRAADGVLLTLMYSRGLDLPQRYSNCEYLENSAPEMGDFAWSTALCSIDGEFEAGGTYTLETPLTVKSTERAYYDTFIYRIHEDGADQRAAHRAGARFDRGTGPALTLKKVPSARGLDLNPRDNQQEADFRTKNTADFVAYGDKASGAEGDTVKADIGFRNKGPAWIGYLRSGEDVATVDFTVPQGASVTAKPDSCRGVSAGGNQRDEQLGAPRYVCDTSMTVREDAEVTLPFELKIHEKLIGASGKVTVRNIFLSDPALPFDPKPANNSALLVLNGEDSGSEDSGGTSEGSEGATAGSTGGSASGTSGEAPASGTSGGGTSGTSGSTSGSTGAAGGGSLASTGSVALLASGAAAVALAAGGVLYATTRRRVRQD
ncbi:peptidase [Streptomyces sp. NBC_00654]|uniref:peptidase n=1 Tax=Streptomyces sp. NBC_00654 TaxID=2975799 RepID=UPI0022500D9C|nr:peptidase [Streptomyces sp. NBC_00654]MCX4964320.1 peptidase [Streptomyces sp. NBC_00654]